MTDLAGDDVLLQQAAQGDSQALGVLFAKHEPRLRRTFQFRLDRRLRGRVSLSDVLQETFLEVSRCLTEYLKNPEMPFFLWLRLLAQRKLQAIHRFHLGAQCRDAARDVPLDFPGVAPTDSGQIAQQLLGQSPTPSDTLLRAELQQRVQEALLSLGVNDQRVLFLRHFEQLTNQEIAHVLELSEAAASNRYVRALQRLKSVLIECDWTIPPES